MTNRLLEATIAGPLIAAGIISTLLTAPFLYLIHLYKRTRGDVQ